MLFIGIVLGLLFYKEVRLGKNNSVVARSCDDCRVWARHSCLGPEQGPRAEDPRAYLA